MRGAADDLDAGGVVAELFAGLDASWASVPGLRLAAVLHRLVLAGRAPELAPFYPDAGGTRPPQHAWPLAAAVLRAHAPEARERLPRTVQTNEPGRAAALYGALLWLLDRIPLPVRLLEIGASAGLNLRVDRFAYVVDGQVLGDPGSPLVLEEPWVGRPVPAPARAAAALRITDRAGCDPAPLDPEEPEDRLTLLSYVWPDEEERLARARAALAVAARVPAPVQAEPTAAWLGRRLAAGREGELTVLWQSVVRQYVDDADWAGIEAAVEQAGADADPGRPLAWIAMEPGDGRLLDFELRATTWPGDRRRRLARVDPHGAPVRWDTANVKGRT